MSHLKILIADSADDFCTQLAQKLQERYNVRTCRDGIRAQELLATFVPDIWILDMLLPGLDGITLLQRAQQQGLHPAVIAMTGYCSEYMAESAGRFRVCYMMRKPCSPEACAERIEDIALQTVATSAPKADPRTQVSNVLLQLGFSAKLKGYGYLREGVLLFAKDTSQLVTKELYPAIGAKFSSCGERVERAIRSAIRQAWENGEAERWRCYFAQTDAGADRCPTNSEFIARIADHLLLEKEAPCKE